VTCSINNGSWYAHKVKLISAKDEVELDMKVDTRATVSTFPENEEEKLKKILAVSPVQTITVATAGGDMEKSVYILSVSLDGKVTDHVEFVPAKRALLGLNVLAGYSLTLQNSTSLIINRL